MVKVETDRFTGQLKCRLSKAKVHYERRAVVFRLSPRVDTSDAAYKIDDGAVIKARSDEAWLASAGFALRLDSLPNPSGGLVRVPLQRLAGAHTIEIQPRPNALPLKFSLADFDAALADARKEGCADADFI